MPFGIIIMYYDYEHEMENVAGGSVSGIQLQNFEGYGQKLLSLVSSSGNSMRTHYSPHKSKIIPRRSAEILLKLNASGRKGYTGCAL